MTPAEKRVKELIERWLTSLDLHLQYVDLKDSAYNNVQPWPVHDRPTRLVLEHARNKVLELQAANEARLATSDAKFAETFELIVFLANLVGLQHVQRFVPLADPDKHGVGTLTELDGLVPVTPRAASKSAASPANQPTTPNTPVKAQDQNIVAAPADREPGTPRPHTGDTTVQMPPRPPANQPAKKSATAASIDSPTDTAKNTPASTKAPNNIPILTDKAPTKPTAAASDDDATREMPKPQHASAAAATANPAAGKPADKIAGASDVHNLVIADAVRLLNWGRRWHELAELIARIADRPKLPEVRRILRSHRSTIEMRAATEPEAEKEK